MKMYAYTLGFLLISLTSIVQAMNDSTVASKPKTNLEKAADAIEYISKTDISSLSNDEKERLLRQFLLISLSLPLDNTMRQTLKPYIAKLGASLGMIYVAPSSRITPDKITRIPMPSIFQHYRPYENHYRPYANPLLVDEKGPVID